jgi:hypothetical protein
VHHRHFIHGARDRSSGLFFLIGVFGLRIASSSASRYNEALSFFFLHAKEMGTQR